MPQIPLIPRRKVPNLTVPLVRGGHGILAYQTPDQFTLGYGRFFKETGTVWREDAGIWQVLES